MCLLTAGNSLATLCNIRSGIKAGNIWILNKGDISTSTVANGVISAIAMKQGKQAFRFEMNQKGNNISHEFQPSDLGGGDFTHTADFRSLENKAALKQVFESMIGAKIVVIEQAQDDTFMVAGWDVGLTLSADAFSLAKDALGHTSALSIDEEPHGLKHFFVTDVAATLAAAIALETVAT